MVVCCGWMWSCVGVCEAGGHSLLAFWSTAPLDQTINRSHTHTNMRTHLHRVKRQRMAGQSGIGEDFKTWKSEAEMVLRQQYDS